MKMAAMKHWHSYVVILVVSVARISFSDASITSEPIYLSDNDFYTQNSLLKTVPSPRFRLPVSVTPYHYILQMMPILETLPGFARFTAPGKIQIFVDVHEPTRNITLHSLNLTIDHSSVKVEHITNGDLAIASLSYDTEKDFFIIELTNDMVVGEKYVVLIDFIAPIPQDRLNGMYLDYYEDPANGETKYVSTTLFAPYHSRRAFPNFDEPNFRATYDISLGRHENYHSMSNAELIDSYPMESYAGWHWDIFNTTPSISSYVVAMIVSDFSFEEAPPGSFGDKSVRVYAPYYLIDRGAGVYGSKLTADVISYFEEYFIIEYPLPKMYSIALPHFFFNAMENWGLITYKDPILLYIPGETSEADRYRINYVVSHEVAHQWFGNLVNCQWWAYVWLKEGFATFYAHYGINHTHPELEPWTQFIPNVLQVALTFDASNSTHPLENFPETSASVADIYTRIPYEKGASILRMTSSFLGENVFTSGIRLYVDRFQYKGAVQDDVFQALQEAVDSASVPLPTNLKSIMDTWTRQSGFPLIKTAIIDSTTLELSQEKYILDDPSSPDDTWWVPITISPKLNSTVGPNSPDVWIPQGILSVNVTIDTDFLIIVNPEVTGYYRVLYDDDSLQKILKTLLDSHEIIPASSRSQLLDDYFNFAIADYVPYEVVLDMTRYLEKEYDLAVWKTVTRNIKSIYNLISDTEYIDRFKIYFSSTMDTVLEKLDIEEQKGEIGVRAILLSELLEWNCLLGGSKCAKFVIYYTEEWKSNPEKNTVVPVNIQSAIYCGMILNNDASMWNFIYSKYLTESSAAHRSRLAKALTCTTNERNQKWLIQQLNSDETELHEQDKEVFLQYVAANPNWKISFLECLKNNQCTLMKGTKSTKTLASILTSLGGSLHSDEELTWFENFVKDHYSIDESGDMAIIIGAVQSNIIWMNEFAELVNTWLMKYVN